MTFLPLEPIEKLDETWNKKMYLPSIFFSKGKKISYYVVYSDLLLHPAWNIIHDIIFEIQLINH